MQAIAHGSVWEVAGKKKPGVLERFLAEWPGGKRLGLCHPRTWDQVLFDLCNLEAQKFLIWGCWESVF